MMVTAQIEHSHNKIINQKKIYKQKIMKKVYDWNVEVLVHIENNNKKVMIVCSVHTTVHALKLQICKKMGYLLFDTEIDLYGGKQTWRPMKPTSSLQQNGIERSQVKVRAVVKRVKKDQPMDIRNQNGFGLTKNIVNDKNSVKDSAYGLTLVAACTNPNCVNYEEDVQINYGYGQFPIFQLISSLKCELCPYKSQNLRPTMMCTSLQVEKCLYKMIGTVPDKDGLPIDKTIGYNKAIENKNIFKYISGCQWNGNLVANIKHI